jgi:GTP pyrophosphokinase
MNKSIHNELLIQARTFAQPLLEKLELPSGESTLGHVDAVVALVEKIEGTVEMQAAVYLAFTCDQLNKPNELIRISFGHSLTQLALETQKILQIQRQAQPKMPGTGQSRMQIENIRRMLLAFSRDLRVVVLLMANQLQNLRFAASLKSTGFEGIAQETLEVFAPLANRLGIWQIKWEMEDLAFRLLEPDKYKQLAKMLDAKRAERELEIESMRTFFQQYLKQLGIDAEIQGRPKHIYSIAKKMRGKSLDFGQIFDLRALRVIVNAVDDCYRTLSWINENFQMLEQEFDDYIARPKANGYQSLHTVIKNHSGQNFEIQIRTRVMHEFAEFGIAAHWAYKEAGVKGYAGISTSKEQANKMAVLRQLLAWERDLSGNSELQTHSIKQLDDEKIYVLTPEAAIVELPNGSTPIDFAYALHTELGHRCRGAKLDVYLVPLNTCLVNGQTVEITTIKEGGPSRDWLNGELGFVASSRAKAKVRAWFNAQKVTQTISRGRELVEKLLQREGRTAFKLEDLARQLGFDSAAHLFEVVGKDEYSLRHVDLLLNPVEQTAQTDEFISRKLQKFKSGNPLEGVLVVGVDSLLTQLARCCRPAPPDQIRGFVTRGKGVSVHRASCGNFLNLAKTSPDRVVEVAWATKRRDSNSAVFPVDVQVHAKDRQGLLRDISEVFAKEKTNVIGVQTQSVKDMAWMTFTLEVSETSRLHQVLGLIRNVNGVETARRTGA